MRWRFIVATIAAVVGMLVLWKGQILYSDCIGYFTRLEPFCRVDSVYPTRMQGIALFLIAGVLMGVAIQLVYRRPRVPLRPFRIAAMLSGVALLSLGGIVASLSLAQGNAVIVDHNVSCIGPVADPVVFQRCVDLTAAQRSHRAWAVMGSIVAGIGAALIVSGAASPVLPSYPVIGVPLVTLGLLLSAQAMGEMVGFGYCSTRLIYGGSDACPGSLSPIGTIPIAPVLFGVLAGSLIGVGSVLVALRESRRRIKASTSVPDIEP